MSEIPKYINEENSKCKPTLDEFNQMSLTEKRNLILQLQQEENNKWIKASAMIFVVSFAVSILGTVIFIFRDTIF